MKRLLGIMALVAMLGLLRCSQDKSTDTTEIEKKTGINLAKYPDAEAYLQEQLEMCGPGVVEGNEGKNSCGYTFKVDEEFVLNHSLKTGFLYRPNWPFTGKISFFTPKVTEPAPANFDIRTLMTGGQPPIKDQVNNDCWANASTSGLELAVAAIDKKPVQFSTQTTISCSGEGTASAGGYMEAFDFVKNGLPLEMEWPYTGRDLKCKYTKDELAKGWLPKMIGTPYIGNSLDYSVGLLAMGGFSEGTKVKNIKNAIWAWKAPAVVTVAAYSISGDGVYDSCSALNSGGNHMVNIVGWQGENALVWNSWGKGHGKDGVSKIKWECGDGKLNRGLGVAAKIAQYKSPCTPPVVEFEKGSYVVLKGGSIKLGIDPQPGVTCQWVPTDGVENPKDCRTFITPARATEYHLLATNDCGTTSAMVFIDVWGPLGRPVSDSILTPHGEVNRAEVSR